MNGTSSSAGVVSGRLNGSCLMDSVRSACSAGRFGVRGRCMAGSDRGPLSLWLEIYLVGLLEFWWSPHYL